MKKSIQALGKILEKSEQKNINGGLLPIAVDRCRAPYFSSDGTCDPGYYITGHCICCKL